MLGLPLFGYVFKSKKTCLDSGKWPAWNIRSTHSEVPRSNSKASGGMALAAFSLTYLAMGLPLHSADF